MVLINIFIIFLFEPIDICFKILSYQLNQMNFKPKLYSDANVKKPIDYFDYENFNITYGDIENYEIVRKVGRGKYSDVFEGINVTNSKKVIIKCLKPIRKKKIKREIKILQNLAQNAQVAKLVDVVKDPASKTHSLIFEYF